MIDWNAATLWWMAAGLLVAAELLTGTFYLLMLALGAAAAALAAHAGLGLSAQMATAALTGGGAVTLWHLWRQRAGAAAGDAEDTAQHLDLGASVMVEAWQADGSSRVQHRGAAWDARWAGLGDPQPGWHVVRGLDANRLLLDRA